MTVRFDLIDREIAWAEAEEAKGEMSAWNQESWKIDDAPCGTAYCLAGHVVAQAGAEFVEDDYPFGAFQAILDGEYDSIDQLSNRVLDLPDVEKVTYPVYPEPPRGQEAEDEYYRLVEECDERVREFDLYAPYNTVADLKRIRDNLAEAEGVPTKWR